MGVVDMSKDKGDIGAQIAQNLGVVLESKKMLAVRGSRMLTTIKTRLKDRTETTLLMIVMAWILSLSS